MLAHNDVLLASEGIHAMERNVGRTSGSALSQQRPIACRTTSGKCVCQAYYRAKRTDGRLAQLSGAGAKRKLRVILRADAKVHRVAFGEAECRDATGGRSPLPVSHADQHPGRQRLGWRRSASVGANGVCGRSVRTLRPVQAKRANSLSICLS